MRPTRAELRVREAWARLDSERTPEMLSGYAAQLALRGYQVVDGSPLGCVTIAVAVPEQSVSPNASAADGRPGMSTADLRAQLDDELAQERRERERATQSQDRRFEVDPDQVERHRIAVAAAGWRYCSSLCRHEAGHAVVGALEQARGGAQLLGARFKYNDSGQMIIGGETEFATLPSALTWAASAAAAQALHVVGEWSDRLSPGDVAALERAGVRTPDAQRQIVQRAAGLLRRHCEALRLVADALFRDGAISAAVVREIIATERPPRASNLRPPAPVSFDDLTRSDWLTLRAW